MTKGLIHIYTGEGKGKTTASVGLAVRAKSRGWRVLFAQFMKPDYTGGELDLLEKLLIVTRRFTRIKPPRFHPETDRAELKKRSFEALREIQHAAQDFDLVIIDEFNNLVGSGIISEREAVDFMKSFCEGTELVLTGRGATEAMIDAADYVTYMNAVKHPFDRGQTARQGIEF
ncbi:MAG: cob(I)yrinic acid a,c-diamide adenosyltransferase [Nitrospirae bacterium]|nr:cob(I)yrinic acid a,c-diamide adenosyltransferase [Nitrospirota bacterium]